MFIAWQATFLQALPTSDNISPRNAYFNIALFVAGLCVSRIAIFGTATLAVEFAVHTFESV